MFQPHEVVQNWKLFLELSQQSEIVRKFFVIMFTSEVTKALQNFLMKWQHGESK